MNTYSISDDESSKRSEQAPLLPTFVGRVMVTLAVAMMGFGGFGPMTATAEAPDKFALAKLNQNAENYFAIESREILTREERAQYIENYFSRWNLPAADYADEFVIYADMYELDWRLLPAIAKRETTACKYTIEHHKTTKRKNNCFGWGNASFGSIEEGIAYVAKNLGGQNPSTAQYYAGKDLKAQLYAYNSVIPDYYDDITWIMEQIYDQQQLFTRASQTEEKPNA